MRSPINAPVLATAFAIGLGFLAQAANPADPYQGPLLKLWNATFHSEPVETPSQFTPQDIANTSKSYWL
ncbi:hypothetical protein [uncultured Pelagimonas sp.]|uniref:hypothetical protein n=1 Tax=uncultured Pelagimonas sp. TaxID=1618102 RepID=UPI002639AE84|nr:hypothetical protein [uncultured Pelagimonas sp.]